MSNSHLFGFRSLYRASDTGKIQVCIVAMCREIKVVPGGPLASCHLPSKKSNRQKFAESNDPVPAQGRIYIYVDGPMTTSTGIICNYLVLGLLFQRFGPNECTIVHSTGGRNELAFGDECTFVHSFP